MTLDEIALQLAIEMMRKAGVREWENAEVREAIGLSAREMAVDLYFGDLEMTTQAVYMKHGTPITFGSEGTDTCDWTTEALANAAGRQSVMYDQGDPTTPRPLLWEYRIYTQAQATPTVGQRFNVYLKTSDGTHPDNDDGAGDAAVSSINKLVNLTLLQSPIVDEAAANIEYVAKGVIEIPWRYFGVVAWNAMGSAVTNDVAETKAIFTPIFEDIQAAA